MPVASRKLEARFDGLGAAVRDPAVKDDDLKTIITYILALKK